jgi:hypothetical protein
MHDAIFNGVPILTPGAVIEIAAEAAAQLRAASASGSHVLAATTIGCVAITMTSKLQCMVHAATGKFEVLCNSRADVLVGGSGQILGRPATKVAEKDLSRKSAKSLSLLSLRTAPQSMSSLDCGSTCQGRGHTFAAALFALDSTLHLAIGTIPSTIEACLVGAKVGKEATAVSGSGALSLRSKGAAIECIGIGSPMTKMPELAQRAAPQQEANTVLYGVCWHAEAPLETEITPLDTGFTVISGKTVALALEIALLQQVAEISGRVQATLADASAFSAPFATGKRDIVAAGLHGMLKAAVLEHPTLAINTSYDADHLSSWKLSMAGGEHAIEGNTSDVYGSIRSRQLAMVPRLLPSTRASKPHLGQFMGGNHIVTGGSGILGGHVAIWLLEQSAERVVLISRSGTLQRSVIAAAPRNTLVLSAKCDAAFREDGYGVFALPDLQLLQSLMHVGGVLADATLANQSPAGMRSVSLLLGFARLSFERVKLAHYAYLLTTYLKFIFYFCRCWLQRRWLRRTSCSLAISLLPSIKPCFHQWQLCSARQGRQITVLPMPCWTIWQRWSNTEA